MLSNFAIFRFAAHWPDYNKRIREREKAVRLNVEQFRYWEHKCITLLGGYCRWSTIV